MKVEELITLGERLQKNYVAFKNLDGAKFTYALIKNIKLIEEEITTIQKNFEPTEAFKKYDAERVELCEKMARKDENDKPIKNPIGDGQFKYDIDLESEEWKSAFAELQEKHKDAIDAAKASDEKFKALLGTESSVKFLMIDIADIDPKITVDLMNIIYPFIKE